MRICCYTSTSLPKIGGQELVIDALARRFCGAGHEVVVLAPRSREPVRGDVPPPPYETAWHPRYRSTRWFVGWHGRWLAALQRARPFDILHCHDTYPSAYVAACCRETVAVPMVITSHGGDLDPDSLLERKPQLRPRYVQAVRRADAVVAVSRYTAEQFRRLCPGMVRVASIPNGVDVARFAQPVRRPAALDAAIRPDGYLLFLGRMVYRKGVDLLLDAFARVAAGTPIELVIAGEGPQRAEFEARAARLPCAARIRFLGQREGDAKTWLLQNARCAVVPSRISESFGLVVLESAAAGRPAIAAGLPGLADLVEPERTGLVFPPGSVDELAYALSRAIGQRARFSQFGRAAAARARSYDWQAIAAQHLELYDELIAAGKERRAA